MKIGTESEPLTSAEPAKIADVVLRMAFTTGDGERGLHVQEGRLLQWDGDRWVARDEEWLARKVWLLMEDAHVVVQTQQGNVILRYGTDTRKVSEIVNAIMAKCHLEEMEVPCWSSELMGMDGAMDREVCVALDEKVVEVKGSGLKEVTRGSQWVDTVVVPEKGWKGEEEPRRWLECVDEWGGGDPEWAELLARWMGYCLLPHTRYAKWLLMYGKVRSGKGTISKVMQAMLGRAFVGTTLRSLAGRFGRHGLVGTRVFCVHEVSRLDSRDGEAVSELVKMVVGGDPMEVDRKGKSELRNVVLRCKPMLQANEIPLLPNKGRGMSSKMLILPFTKSFLGKEDPRLDEKLLREMGGIVRWALEGAQRLERDGGTFPMPKEAGEVMKSYLNTNNPLEEFLWARFVPEAGWSLPLSVVWDQWESWKKQTKTRMHVSKNRLLPRLMSDTTWDLERRTFEGRTRVGGMALRKEPLDH